MCMPAASAIAIARLAVSSQREGGPVETRELANLRVGGRSRACSFGLTYKRISTREDDKSIISLPILLDQLCDIIPFYESASPLSILKWTKIKVWAQETRNKMNSNSPVGVISLLSICLSKSRISYLTAPSPHNLGVLNSG